jgi:hypothetical protein
MSGRNGIGCLGKKAILFQCPSNSAGVREFSMEEGYMYIDSNKIKGEMMVQRQLLKRDGR